MPESPQPLAVFDFDDTLAQGDSMPTFLIYVAGWPNFILACLQALGVFLVQHFLHQENRERVDRNTFFKQQLLQRLVAGRSLEDMRDAVSKLQLWVRWNEPMRRALQDHYEQGHHIVIASGALDLYLPALIKDLPHHAVLCTDIEIVDGKATATMPHGNCVRRGKAERVVAYIAAYGPFGESWGYGNFPDDVPMMALLRHRIIV